MLLGSDPGPTRTVKTHCLPKMPSALCKHKQEKISGAIYFIRIDSAFDGVASEG